MEMHNGCSELFAVDVKDIFPSFSTGTAAASGTAIAASMVQKIVSEVQKPAVLNDDGGNVVVNWLMLLLTLIITL